MGKKPKDISEFSEEKQNRILAARRACKKYREKKQAEDSGYLNKIKHANVEYYAKNRDRISQQRKLNKILKKQSQVNNLFQNVANNSITEVSSNNASELNFPNTSLVSSQDNSNSFQYIDDNSQDDTNKPLDLSIKNRSTLYYNSKNRVNSNIELSDSNSEFIDINEVDPLDLSMSNENLSTIINISPSTKINTDPKKKNYLESVISRITNSKSS